MDIRKMDWYRKRSIALRMLLITLLQLCSPLADIAVVQASPLSPNLEVSPTHTVGTTDGSNSKYTYSTLEYNITLYDSDGNAYEIPVTAHPTTDRSNGKTVTTHVLDTEELLAKADSIMDGKEIDWSKSQGADGMVHLKSDNTIGIKKDGVLTDRKVTGPAGMQNCGIDWSTALDKGLASKDPEKNPAQTVFVFPLDVLITEPPTSTPVPTAEPKGPDPITPKPTNTPIPTNAPIDPPVTEVPPTPEPSPVPSATPYPTAPPHTPTPQVYYYRGEYEYNKYYSTSNGFSISNITVNGKIADDSSATAASLAEAVNVVGKRSAYAVGTDAGGNQWYILPSATATTITGLGSVYTATSVHPKIYGGQAVEGTGIRHISNLVFPEYVTYNGRNYYVTSIGGSGPYYYSNASAPPSGTIGSSLGQIMGEYSWAYGGDTWDFAYLLGCIGNGTITSNGHGIDSRTSYDTYVYDNKYTTNHYVYNTTLSSITIPTYCTTVEDYAFHNCQALTSINGGANLTTIGKHAFSVSDPPKLQQSYKSDSYSYACNPYYTVDRMYSYDNSYTYNYLGDYTDTMKNCVAYMELPLKMTFPTLPKLVTVKESAFEGHCNLDDAELPDTTRLVEKNAFKGCTLEYIAVGTPLAVIEGDYETLGTKGNDVALLTMILTPNDDVSYPIDYGTLYDDYYRLAQDVYINYYPNGGSPNEVYRELQEVKYARVSFGDQCIDYATDHIMWLGEDGTFFTAKVIDETTVQGGPYAALANYKFSTLEEFSVEDTYFSQYFMATTENGVRYLIKSYAPTDTEPVLSLVCVWNPPVEVISCVEGDDSARSLVCTGSDGRYHWLQNGVWLSEPEWPGTVDRAGTVNTSTSVLPFHHVVMCTDGYTYTKHAINVPWSKLEELKYVNGTFAYVPTEVIAISADGTRIVVNKSGTTYLYYVNVGASSVSIQQSGVCSMNNGICTVSYQDSYNQWVTYEVKLEGPFSQTLTGGGGMGLVLANPTLYYSFVNNNGVQYGGETIATVKKNPHSKVLTMDVNSRSWHEDQYGTDGEETTVTHQLGTGELIGLRVGSTSGAYPDYVSYYLDPAGRINKKTGAGNTVLSTTQFVKVVPLTTLVAPTYSGWQENSQNFSASYKWDYVIGSNGSYNNGPAYIQFLALDTNGYLWYGECVYYNSTHTGNSNSLTRLDNKVYLDISGSYRSKTTQSSYSGEWGYSSSTNTTITTYVHALDTNKDVYEYSFKSSESGSSYSSSQSGSGNSRGGTFYPAKDFALTYMPYADDVEKLPGFPFVVFANGKPGLLTTMNPTIDIYCGIEVKYRVSRNKWYYAPAGTEFNSWNTAANGSGTRRIPSDEPIPVTILDGNFSGSSASWNLYAQWAGAPATPKYVYYDANGGSGTTVTTTIPAGGTAFTVSSNGFTKRGYSRAAYFTENADGTGNRYYPGTTYTYKWSTSYVVLYAQWEPYTYNVKFAFDEVRIDPVWFFISQKGITADRKVIMPTEPQHKEVNVDYDINTNSHMSTATLAKWLTARPLAEKYYRSVQQFQGWDLYHYNTNVNNYVGGFYRFGELDEVYGLTDVNNDTVYMFPAWGGIDAYVMLPEVSCPGYNFYGWMNDKTQETATETLWYIPEEGGGLYLPKGNDTLYAWWEPCEYEITFVQTMEGRNPDVAGTPSVTMTFDEVCPSVTAPHIEHYVFTGYNTKPDGTGDWYYGEADRDSHITEAFVDKTTGQSKRWQVYDGSVTTLYAQWRPDKAIQYEPNYTWTPDNALANDIYSIDDILGVEDNTVFVVTDEPTFMLEPLYYTRRGYTFKHWTLHADGTGNAFADRAVIETNAPWLDGIIPIYAQWMPNPYTIAYDLKGNKPNASTETQIEQAPTAVIYDVSFTVTNPVKKGYTFLGWDITGMSECTHYYGSNTTNVTSLTGIMDTSFKNLHHAAGATVTFTAMWKVKEFDVILNDRGATGTGHTEQVHMIFDEYGPDIIVPTKTGYTFHGYYTGIRGAGKQYYDADGRCIVPWTEDDVYELFAYWVQDPVLLPDEDDHIDPVVPPQTDNEDNIGRTDHKGLLYADDYNDATGALTDLQPYLTYDTPASEGVIPGTEYLALRAKMGSWMLSYKFHRMSGTDTVNIVVTVPYRTQYEIEETEELVISDLMTATYTIPVPKSWSYWEVVESGMYYPDKLTVRNEAMKEPVLEVEVDRTGANAVAAPQYSAKKYGDKENHVKWQEYDGSGTPTLYIEFPEQQYIISNKLDTPPDIAPHLGIICRNAAWADTRQAEVRSDKYEFDGNVILSDAWQTQHGAELDKTKLPATADDIKFTSYEQTYKSGIELDELKPNGKYETTAVVTYVGDEENIGTPATKEVDLTDINDLNIHTPVACDGVFTDGIGYKTDENGAELAVLTLKEALNFFTLRIDNTGIHRMNLGYGTKDFAFALSGKSNVAEADGAYLNQVKFLFDVYVDMGSDSRNADGTYNTTGDCFFEAGTWLTISDEEKTFYVPVTQKNGTYQIEFRTIAVNLGRKEEYSDTMELYMQQYTNTNPEKYISSDAVELTIQSYLRDFLITGTDDSHAEKQRKQGKQALVLKKGYQYSFDLLSQGEFYGENTKLCIIPSFFWVSEDETEREEAILYSETYQAEQKPRECYKWEGIPLLEQHQFHEVILQRFSGTGYLPEDVLCVPVSLHQEAEDYMKRETITGKETFFKQTGYLVVHFNIKLRSEEGVWYSFDHWENTGIYCDAVAAEWNYIPGDVIRYDLSKSISDDYEIGGIE